VSDEAVFGSDRVVAK